MKRTVYNTMIGLMLASGLAMTSTGALAQGRRPASTNSAAAAGNRSVATATPKNNAATVTNNSAPVSRSTATSSARPSVSSSTQVNRNTSVSSNASNRSAVSTTRPTVNNSSTSTVRPSTSSSSTVRNGNNGSNVRPSAGNRSASGSSVSTTVNSNTSNVRPVSNGNKANTNNGGSNLRPGSGNNSGSNNTVSPGNSNSGKTGHVAAPTRRPSDNRPKVAGTVMAGGGPKIDYSTYRYTSNWRPRYGNDPFFYHYRDNSWSWANPIRPSVRPWRPTTVWVYRPIVTVNISRYSSYPTIGGVLGLSWGTSFGNALNYLYYNGYYIDGFMDNVVYLTDVSLLNYDWDDVMIQFDGNDRMDYVEFAYWNSSYDTSRFYSLYNYLCSMYGSPVSYNNAMYSWYGGDGIGFVNLGFQYTPDYNYTVLAFGV